MTIPRSLLAGSDRRRRQAEADGVCRRGTKASYAESATLIATKVQLIFNEAIVVFNEAIVVAAWEGLMWTEQSLQSVTDALTAPRGDSASIQAKRASSGLASDLPETLCAFASTPEGGTRDITRKTPDGLA